MSLGSHNFGLSGARGIRIVRRFHRTLLNEDVLIEVRSKTQNTVRVGWNYTAKSDSTEVEGFTNVLTLDEAIKSASEKWANAKNE